MTNQANAQAQANAAERDQIANQIQADQDQAQKEQVLAADVALASQDDNPAKRRRQVQAQFNIGGVDGSSSQLRL